MVRSLYLRCTDHPRLHFLWGKTDKIKREIVINEDLNGGLNMIDIQTQFESIKANWVKRYIQDDGNDWAFIMHHYMNLFGKNILLHTNFDRA